MSIAQRTGHRATPAVRPAPTIAVGALCGVAWAAGLRAYMAEIAGPGAAFGWAGTFACILLPGTVIGAMYAWAVTARRHDPHLRWVRASPLLFAILPLMLPGALADLVTQGLGSGAIGVALIAVIGGFALGTTGPRWSRIAAGVTASILVALIAASVPLFGGDALAATSPRGLWVVVLATSLMTLLVVASAIPWRAGVDEDA